MIVKSIEPVQQKSIFGDVDWTIVAYWLVFIFSLSKGLQMLVLCCLKDNVWYNISIHLCIHPSVNRCLSLGNNTSMIPVIDVLFPVDWFQSIDQIGRSAN